MDAWSDLTEINNPIKKLFRLKKFDIFPPDRFHWRDEILTLIRN